jgi:hypothetical protein
MDSKEQLINTLTLLETAMYRCTGYALTGKYSKEPSGFRVHLYDIYSKLSNEDLVKLIELKNQQEQ